MPLPSAIADVKASTLTSMPMASTGRNSDAEMLAGSSGHMARVPQ